MATREKLSEVIAKIQKLRRLSAKAGTVHEAATAAALADKLIQEHGFVEAELQAQGEAPREAPTEAAEPLTTWNGRIHEWQLRLCTIICAHYDCACYLDVIEGDTPSRHSSKCAIIGRASDVEAARFMYAMLSVEVESAAKQSSAMSSVPSFRIPRGRSFYNAFRHGAVSGIDEALTNSKRRARDQARVSSTALAIIDNRLAEALAVKAQIPFDGERTSARGQIDALAYARGKAKGLQLPGQVTTKKIGEET